MTADRLHPYQREFLDRLKLDHGNALSVDRIGSEQEPVPLITVPVILPGEERSAQFWIAALADEVNEPSLAKPRDGNRLDLEFRIGNKAWVLYCPTNVLTPPQVDAAVIEFRQLERRERRWAGLRLQAKRKGQGAWKVAR